MSDYSLIYTKSKARIIIVYVFVLFSGFANLATEIIGPRLIASLFGSTTVIWATIISVTLLGISLGYFFGGRIPYRNIPKALQATLILNAFWLLGISWFIWKFPERLLSFGYFSILIIVSISFLIPAMLFSMASPMSITLLSHDRLPEWIARMVGRILAVGTLGSVLGALFAAFILIPQIGLSVSLQGFAFACVLFAGYFTSKKYRPIFILPVLFCIFFPQPAYHWMSASGWLLLDQREGYYQTIRVYTDETTFVRMHLGPSYETEMNLETGEPNFKYARLMVELLGDVSGKKVLIIGGAGHSQGRMLEALGAELVEVEIDPYVVKLSDQYFGPIKGEVVVQDGRTYIAQSQAGIFDFVLVDAFSGPDSVPPQLTTVEFFEDVRKVLKPDGQMLYNFIGVPTGPRSNSYLAISSTMRDGFDYVCASSTQGPIIQNIILTASQQPISQIECHEIINHNLILTDNLNPIEIYLEQARAGEIYYRR